MTNPPPFGQGILHQQHRVLRTGVTESRVDEVLANPFDYDWSIQGFGMLRCYLDDEGVARLHIWDTGIAVDNVSTIHDHPWDFTSRVVRGRIINQRYTLCPMPINEPGVLIAPLDWDVFQTAQIRCGEGGGLVTPASWTLVQPSRKEIYLPADSYSMLATELHESFPLPGTVTVIERTFHADRDIATVCWRGKEWVSAEPRPATKEEIEHFVALARG